MTAPVRGRALEHVDRVCAAGDAVHCQRTRATRGGRRVEGPDVTAVDFAALEAELADPLAPGSILPLDDASHHFLREAFAQTSNRWEQLYAPDILSPDAGFVLQMMTSRVAESPAEDSSWEDYDPRLSGVLSTGLGGYVWRAAEESAGRTVGTEIVDGIREAIGSVDQDHQLGQIGATSEQGALYQASARALAQHVPLWYTSPGYLVWGGILFRAGRRFVSERLASSEPAADPGDLAYAFSFGVALRHVEQQLARPEAPQPGEWAGPAWETCEIELRTETRTFVAVAETTEGRRLEAESRQLPANRLPLPLSIDRRPMQIMERHQQLVDDLKRQGWVPMAGKGRDWWSDRFRRRIES